MAAGGDFDTGFSEINVTPLVDVILVLLIIFMITAPLLLSGIQVQIPASQAGSLPAQPAQPLVITIDKRGQIFMDQQPLPLLELQRRLPAWLAGRKGQAVYLRADEGVPYGSVVRVLDVLDEAGAEAIGLVTREDR
jgi:biopolymer transport protein ExbD